MTTSESTTTKTTTTSIKNDKHINTDEFDAGDDDDDKTKDDNNNNNTCKSVDFIKPILYTDNNTRDVKLPVVRRGSLLSRPTGSFLPGFKSELPKKASSFTEDFDTDSPTNSGNNNSSNNSQNNRHGNHAHLLGLRNKVGLSCFTKVTPNVKPEKSDSSFDNVDSASNQSAVQGSSKCTTIKHKRSMDMIKPHSALLSPPSLKRHRSTSVFTALL
ncbi:unnamed protein product [Trichobilharzia regenti]|nr:unnamed protein product [Trichobilharzia regenti]